MDSEGLGHAFGTGYWKSAGDLRNTGKLCDDPAQALRRNGLTQTSLSEISIYTQEALAAVACGV